MSKRLQVLFEEREYKAFQRLAKNQGLSLGEWVRLALRDVANRLSTKSPQSKLKNIRKSAKQSYPSGDIDEILSQIESGYTT